MIEQRRFALDACRAVIRELDARLSDDSHPTPEERNHHVWLVTAASILIDIAVEFRNEIREVES
jgi:hypothetical protein